jgi:polysaccharide pyruvyl transferase WcaK-like protein
MQVRPRDVVVELAKERDIFNGLQTNKPLASYIGWTGQGNLGDEVLLEAHQLLFGDFTVVPYRPENAFQGASQAVFGSPGFTMGFLGGGTLINQSPTWLRRIQELQRRGLPVFCLGAGVTPDEFRPAFERTTIADWVKVLETMEFVGVRGPLSQKALADCGFAATVLGDPAFALTPLSPPPAASRKMIGVNVGISDKTLLWPNSQKYLATMVESIKALIAGGKEVTLLPVCAEDVASNKAVLALVNNEACSIKFSYDSLDNYNLALSECGLFIGQKLHATVLATLLRIPSIMIE